MCIRDRSRRCSFGELAGVTWRGGRGCLGGVVGILSLIHISFERARALEPDVIVTVDCGIACKNEVADILKAGVEVYILSLIHISPSGKFSEFFDMLGSRQSLSWRFSCLDLAIFAI